MRNVSATCVCPPFSIRGHLKKKKYLECGCIYKLVKYKSSNTSIQTSVTNPKITSTLPAERDDSAATFAMASAPSTRSYLLSPESKTTLLQRKRRLGKGDSTPNHHFSCSLKGWDRFDKQTIETLWHRSKGKFILWDYSQSTQVPARGHIPVGFLATTFPVQSWALTGADGSTHGQGLSLCCLLPS